MAFQFTPIAFGLMLMVAVGTLAYTVWNINARPQNQSYSSSTSFDQGYDTNLRWNEDTTEERRKRRAATKDLCSICLDCMKRNLRTLPCKHVFHENCITVWLRSNNTCPLCRTHSNNTL